MIRKKACPALDAGWVPVFRNDHAQTKIRRRAASDRIELFDRKWLRISRHLRDIDRTRCCGGLGPLRTMCDHGGCPEQGGDDGNPHRGGDNEYLAHFPPPRMDRMTRA